MRLKVHTVKPWIRKRTNGHCETDGYGDGDGWGHGAGSIDGNPVLVKGILKGRKQLGSGCFMGSGRYDGEGTG